MCNGCSSLGHTIGACPKVTRTWVQKNKPHSEVGIAASSPIITNVNSEDLPSAVNTANVKSADVPVIRPANTSASGVNVEPIDGVDITLANVGISVTNDEGWKTVLGKKSKASVSPSLSPEDHGVSLPIFTSISRALSKDQNRGQKKRAKKARGKSSPS